MPAGTAMPVGTAMPAGAPIPSGSAGPVPQERPVPSRHTAPAAGAGVFGDPDAVATLDDEDVEGAGEMGQAVIERVLGGKVLDDSTQ